MRIPKKSLVALLGAAGALGSANGQAILLDQSTGNDGTDQIYLTDITNNSGVDFELGSLDYSQLFLDTANLDWNIGNYDGEDGSTPDGYVTLSEFLPKAKTDGDVFFTLDNIGEVYTGWSGNIGNDGIISLTNNGGTANVTYDVWNSTSTNPNQDTMKTILGINNSLYKDPETKTIVPINLDSNQTITDFASGTPGSSIEFTADGLGYNVVPEPSAYGALAGLVALGYVATRRPKRKE